MSSPSRKASTIAIRVGLAKAWKICALKVRRDAFTAISILQYSNIQTYGRFVLVLDDALNLTIGGTLVRATPGIIVRVPADGPHALDASESRRMPLVMLK